MKVFTLRSAIFWYVLAVDFVHSFMRPTYLLYPLVISYSIPAIKFAPFVKNIRLKSAKAILPISFSRGQTLIKSNAFLLPPYATEYLKF